MRVSGGGRWAEISRGRPQQKGSKGQCCSGCSGKTLLWTQRSCEQEKEDLASGKETHTHTYIQCRGNMHLQSKSFIILESRTVSAALKKIFPDQRHLCGAVEQFVLFVQPPVINSTSFNKCLIRSILYRYQITTLPLVLSMSLCANRFVNNERTCLVSVHRVSVHHE